MDSMSTDKGIITTSSLSSSSRSVSPSSSSSSSSSSTNYPPPPPAAVTSSPSFSVVPSSSSSSTSSPNSPPTELPPTVTSSPSSSRSDLPPSLLSSTNSPPPPPPAMVIRTCAACKILRRSCAENCVLAPYFPPNDPFKFAAVHHVFGASNIIKILQDLPEFQRADAVSSMVYEAKARVRDPVYGCAGAICQLQKQVSELQAQLAIGKGTS